MRKHVQREKRREEGTSILLFSSVETLEAASALRQVLSPYFSFPSICQDQPRREASGPFSHLLISGLPAGLPLQMAHGNFAVGRSIQRTSVY
jgi:hypothetical protein